MATGVFQTRPQTSQWAGARNHQIKRATLALDRFASALAEHDLETGDKGGDLRVVALRLNISYSYANAMLQRIKKRLGGQAV